MAIEVFAAAKVNLALHVTGRRADGYHLLDSIVAFADIGDRVTVAASDRLTLEITGPEADHLTIGDDNLVLRAARFVDPVCSARITLAKHLPVAAGIGGGSADAAATLKALARLYGIGLPTAVAAAQLGADVPACLLSRAHRLRGIGELLSDIPRLPELDVLLVNPRVAVSTPEVFARLATRTNAPLADTVPQWADQRDFCGWLGDTRNDLLSPAANLVPEITEALTLIRETDCLFAGMSGTGATCFGLYLPGGHTAKAARTHVIAQRPDWWCQSGRLS